MIVAEGTTGSERLRERRERSLGDVGLALIAGDDDWTITRLSPSGGPRRRADRLNLKRHLEALAEAEVNHVVAFLMGRVVLLGEAGPHLVLGADWERYPDECALPLAWCLETLARRRAPGLVLAVEVETDPEVLEAVDFGGAVGAGPFVVATRALSPDEDARLPEVLGAALSGEARSPELGTVTYRGLADYLSARLPDARVYCDGGPDVELTSPPSWLTEVPGLPVREPPALRLVDPSDWMGEILPGKFRVEGRIGTGAFGAVYLAKQLTVDRWVAVKVLTEGPAVDARLARQFIREIRTLVRLEHANIVRVYQADRDAEGRMFFAMELLEGGELSKVIQRGPLDSDVLTRLGCEALRGLNAAHSAGVVHSDLKPANIGLRAASGSRSLGEAVLLDFGVARLISRGDTSAEGFGGTPLYMAPEQLRGSRADARSDIYSLGVVLWEALLGNPSKEMSLQGRATDIPRGLAPEGLERVLERALAKEPDRRFSSAAEMLEALERCSGAGSVPFELRSRYVPRPAELIRILGALAGEETVLVSGPSGIGKTSLLEELAPEARQLGFEVERVTAHERSSMEVVAQLERARVSELRTLLLVDHFERLLEGTSEAVRDLSRSLGRIAELGGGVRLVACVREDYLPRALHRYPELADASIISLGLIGADETLAFLERDLEQRDVRAEPGVLEGLVADIVATTPTAFASDEAGEIYPPHLRWVWAAVLSSLGPEVRSLGRSDLERLGSATGLLTAHLERQLEQLFPEAEVESVRDILVQLVDEKGRRVVRSEVELGALPGSSQTELLRRLATARLILPARLERADRAWELAHDLLAPKVHSWCVAKDFARARARELLRIHLHRIEGGHASHPSLADLRAFDQYPEVIRGLDAAWTRGELGALDRVPQPSGFLRRERRRLRRRWTSYLVAMAGAFGLFCVLGYREATEAWRKQMNIGSVELRLTAWDVGERAEWGAVAPGSLPELEVRLWQLGSRVAADPLGPEELEVIDAEWVRGSTLATAVIRLEARGSRAALVLRGRHRPGEPPCSPSIIAPIDLPGYGASTPQVMALAFPTCSASRAGQVEIPGGELISGDDIHFPFRIYRMNAVRMDREEASSEMYRRFLEGTAEASKEPRYSLEAAHLSGHPHFGEDGHPATNLSWMDARDYCRWMGRRLPTFAELELAGRGPVCLSKSPTGGCGVLNPMPRRAFPWGDTPPEEVAGRHLLYDPSNDGGRSTVRVDDERFAQGPFGLIHLAGNADEWLADSAADTHAPEGAIHPAHLTTDFEKLIHGGYWRSRHPVQFRVGYADRIMAGNQRAHLGVRCASSVVGHAR